MAKEKNDKKNETYYSQLIVYPRRIMSLLFTLTIFILIATAVIFTQTWMQHHWTSLIIPLGALGTLVALYPRTEEWEYKPWQAQSQRYERHYKGK